MGIVLMLEKEKVGGFIFSSLSQNPTRSEFDEIVRLKFEQIEALNSLRIRRNDIFGTPRRFFFYYFHISVHSFIRDRKHYKTVSLRGGGRGEDRVGAAMFMSPSLPKSNLLTFVIIWLNIRSSLIHFQLRSSAQIFKV